MVEWYHLIMTAYGFWLPNDPRGSWSDFVGAWELYKFGSATKTDERRNLAHDSHDRKLRFEAKRSLKYPAVRFNDPQRERVGAGFEKAVSEGGYIVPACCIGHDHAHLVIKRQPRMIERIAGHLKSKATMELNRAEMHPLLKYRKTDGAIPTPWGEGNWSVYLNTSAHLESAIRYIERHPMKEGLPAQTWPFVDRNVV